MGKIFRGFRKIIHENKGIYMVHTSILQNHKNFDSRKICTIRYVHKIFVIVVAMCIFVVMLTGIKANKEKIFFTQCCILWTHSECDG